jgi:hypothetical protein
LLFRLLTSTKQLNDATVVGDVVKQQSGMIQRCDPLVSMLFRIPHGEFGTSECRRQVAAFCATDTLCTSYLVNDWPFPPHCTMAFVNFIDPEFAHRDQVEQFLTKCK